MRDIKLCHPKLQEKAAALLSACRERNITVKIGETLRTAAEQDALYAQGRTAPGNIVTNARGKSYSSMHQWGVAFDFYLDMDVDGDGKAGDDAYNNSTGLFEAVGALGKGLGLEWGGDWKSIKDRPHFQLPDWGSTPAKLKSLYKTPEAFMKTWGTAAEWVQENAGWRYRSADGTYAAGRWLEIGGHWYWFNGAGYMAAGVWKETRGKWYYLKDDGSMAAGEILDVQGEIYCFASDGAMMEGEIRLTTNARGALTAPRRKAGREP